MRKKIIIFDTTLRDGEQTPGANLQVVEKVTLAKQLEKLGVNVIEAGFPISSPGDFQAVREVGKVVKNAIVCGLSRALKKDIDVAADALTTAKFPRIHTGIGISDIHIKYKLKSTTEKVIDQAIEAVKYAKKYVNDVEFYAEDAGRANPQFLYRILTEVIKAGATTVNIPDTTGYRTPAEFGNLIFNIRENVRGIDKVVISAHCHDDLGLAVANSLAAIENGATQVEATINGVGERAGNASLEEIVVALKVRSDYFQKFYTNINLRKIYKTSRMVSRYLRMPIQKNKAIVGENAFAHSSGIHQDGVLKYRQNYEIIDPRMIGKQSRIILTARSGRHALSYKLSELGYNLNKRQLNQLYPRFLALADRKKKISASDLMSLLEK